MRTPPPTRAELWCHWVRDKTPAEEIARIYGVSRRLVIEWAVRWGMAQRRSYRRVNKQTILREADNHCDETEEGPRWNDPTPEQIAELAAYCRARRMMSGLGCRVWIEPEEVIEWAA